MIHVLQLLPWYSGGFKLLLVPCVLETKFKESQVYPAQNQIVPCVIEPTKWSLVLKLEPLLDFFCIITCRSDVRPEAPRIELIECSQSEKACASSRTHVKEDTTSTPEISQTV